MDQRESINQIERELQQWQKREDRLRSVFKGSRSLEGVILNEKLKVYDYLAAKYKKPVSREERLTLRILKKEKAVIEQKLYPKLLTRLFRRLVLSFIHKKEIKKELEISSENKLLIRRQLAKAGFSGLNSKVEKMMTLGKPSFTLPVSHYLSEKERIDYTLSFSRNAERTYRLSTYKADLCNTSTKGKVRSQVFKYEGTRTITSDEARQLLSGRAIQRETISLGGERQLSWMQLDMAQTDKNGAFRIRQFHPEYGFDLEKVLSRHPIKELKSEAERPALLADLGRGLRKEVTYELEGKDRKVFIEASPQFRTVTFYDEKDRRVDLQKLKTDTREKLSPAQEIKLHAVNREDTDVRKHRQRKSISIH